ncbi:MAG TPA: DUF3147 family protein [Solirubrobacteraceae bacterium]|nr:DUF3147 family protein [Solirubrobacteraceae bacterium]
MSNVAVLAIKGLAGGTLVVVFALISEGLRPKRFAGLFSASPAVALAGLTITLIFEGARAAHESSLGMVVGSVALVAYAAAAIPLLRKFRASIAAAVALLAWLLAAVVVAIPMMIR